MIDTKQFFFSALSSNATIFLYLVLYSNNNLSFSNRVIKNSIKSYRKLIQIIACSEILIWFLEQKWSRKQLTRANAPHASVSFYGLKWEIPPFLFCQFNNSTLYWPHKIKNKQKKIYYPIKWCISRRTAISSGEKNLFVDFLSDRIALKCLKISIWFLEQKWSRKQLSRANAPHASVSFYGSEWEIPPFFVPPVQRFKSLFLRLDQVFTLTLIGENFVQREFAPADFLCLYIYIYIYIYVK